MQLKKKLVIAMGKFSRKFKNKSIKNQKISKSGQDAEGKRMLISANMATIPERIGGAYIAISSIIDQVDVVRVYLNNFSGVPDFIKNTKKIEYVIGGRDLNASGKHFWSHNPDEYYFTIDDDIIYPKDYVKSYISEMKKYNDKVVLTTHGTIFERKINNFYNDLDLEKIHFNEKVLFHRLVTLGGTGLSLRNTNVFKVDLDKFEHHDMDDIEVSIQANQKKIPIVALSHGAMKSIDDPALIPRETTIYSKNKENDSMQVERFNSHDWKTYLPEVEEFKNKKISVIISGYNASTWIKEAVYSVLAQDLPFGWSVEVLVGVDGCSSTLEAVQEIQDPRVGIVYFEDNRGTYSTFNSTLRYSQGSIIQRLDADDILYKGWLTRVISSMLLNDNLKIIEGGVFNVNEDMTMIEFPGMDYPFPYKASTHGFAAWKRKYFKDKIGGYSEERFGSDTQARDTVVFGHKDSLYIIPFPGLMRRIHDKGSLISSPDTGFGTPERLARQNLLRAEKRKMIRTGYIPKKIVPSPRSGVMLGELFSSSPKQERESKEFFITKTYENALKTLKEFLEKSTGTTKTMSVFYRTRLKNKNYIMGLHTMLKRGKTKEDLINHIMDTNKQG